MFAVSSVLITGPSLRDQGGVASYYNAVLPHLRMHADAPVHYLEIGSTHRRGGLFYPLVDQYMLRRSIRGLEPTVVLINPSLDPKSFIRDGMFIRHAKRDGRKVVVFFRGWNEDFAAQVESKWQWFFRETYLRADLFVVLASSFRDSLRRWGVSVPVELATTAVASDLVAEFSLQGKQEQLRKNPVVKVLFLARLLKEKGIIETLEAVATLREQGKPLALTVAGDGRAMPDARQFIARRDPGGEYLMTTGDVRAERKRALLESHDVYCFPTYSEGMPNSVLEAMAFGMPVVTCATGGLKDFFDHGKMGYFVRRRDSDDVAHALSRLVESRTLREEIGTYNHRYASEQFLAPGAAGRLLSLYRAVVQPQ